MSEHRVYEISDSLYTYTPNPQHRDNKVGKSKWLRAVKEEDEFNIFELALKNNWILDDERNGWGLFFYNEKIKYLGVINNPRQKLSFIAKFVNDKSRNDWHGYPADHIKHTHDKPHADILNQWMIKGFIPRAKMRKILRSHPCRI